MIQLQADTTTKAIEKVLKNRFDDISVEEDNALFNEYPKRLENNPNPFSVLNSFIAHKGKLQFREVLDQYKLNLSLDGSSDEEEAEMDDAPKLLFSHIDAYLLKCFELEIVFDGSFNDSSTILNNCKKGNIFCRNCGKQILEKTSL